MATPKKGAEIEATWTYRIHREKTEKGWKYTVREAFDGVGWHNGVIWTAAPAIPEGETPAELIACLEMMLKDCKKKRKILEDK